MFHARRICSVLCAALAAISALMAEVSVAVAAERPNIVFLFADDQAPWALGEAGHPHAATPHLDRLFREGAYLKNAFTTTPVCSPSRASLLASRYGSELGVTDWINPRKEPEHGLDPSMLTWPEILQRAGYHTGLVGKWHLGTADRFHPTQNGFDYFMGFRPGGAKTKDPVLEVEGKQVQLHGLTTDLLADDAVRFLERNKGRTFLLCLHFRAPHTRWLPVADEDWAPYDGLDPQIPNPDYRGLDVERVKRVTREYLASVSGVDRNVGRVLAALKRLGLKDNTIVIYSSDHGYNMGHNGIWHKGNGHWILKDPPAGTTNVPKNQRPNMYDHSLRVPTAVRWPGVIRPGTVISETISNLDWFPTILAMASVTKPAAVQIRGKDFLPLLRGEATPWDNDFYAEYSTHHQSRTHMRMYRTPSWKLMRDFLNSDRDELYDLKNDPAETTNLIRSTRPGLAHLVTELDAKILQHMKANGDPALDLAHRRSSSSSE